MAAGPTSSRSMKRRHGWLIVSGLAGGGIAPLVTHG